MAEKTPKTKEITVKKRNDSGNQKKRSAAVITLSILLCMLALLSSS